MIGPTPPRPGSLCFDHNRNWLGLVCCAPGGKLPPYNRNIIQLPTYSEPHRNLPKTHTMQQPSHAKAIPGIVVSKFDNSGSGPLLVPGFSGMACFVEAEPQVGRRRFGYAIHNRWPMRATAREISMIRAIEKVTDRPDWHQDVFSEEKLAEWKEEATAADWKISDKA